MIFLRNYSFAVPLVQTLHSYCQAQKSYVALNISKWYFNEVYQCTYSAHGQFYWPRHSYVICVIVCYCSYIFYCMRYICMISFSDMKCEYDMYLFITNDCITVIIGAISTYSYTYIILIHMYICY